VDETEESDEPSERQGVQRQVGTVSDVDSSTDYDVAELLQPEE
jgi:hypothetical protein